MPDMEDSKTKSAFPLAAVSLLAAGHLLLHLLTNGSYGMFRDEFYYLACADHPAWGYVDHPPLSIALLIVNRAIVGDSVEAIRILPGLLGVILLFTSAAIARELGGGRFAQLLGLRPGSVDVTALQEARAYRCLETQQGPRLHE